MADIIGFIGKLSSGKTATAIYFCIDDFNKGRKIISNIKLQNIPHTYISSENLADFIILHRNDQEFLEKTFSYSTLLLDEIRVLLSSTKHSSNLNEIMSQFIFMLGKLDTNCYFTFQRFNMVSTHLREITDYVIQCHRIRENGNIFFGPRIPYITPKGEIIPSQQATKQDKPLKLYIQAEILEVIDVDTIQTLNKFFTYDPSIVFNKYNTREIVIVDREKYLKK